MRSKAYVVAVVFLAVLLVMSAVFAEQETAGDTDVLETALQAAKTTEEVRQLMKACTEIGDYESALRCADRMLEVDPENQTDWYYVQAEFRLQMLQSQYAELNVIIAQGMERLDDPSAYTEWIRSYVDDNKLSVQLPFVSDYALADEINTYGIASSNYSYGGGVHNEWQNGLLTSQGDWVYFSAPAEGYAIYKMRLNGENKQRLGEDSGCFLNVVGDWIYYCNITENNSIYKMRTDGSNRTQVADETCSYLAVCGDWIVYASDRADERLFKMQLDGSEVTQVWGSPAQFPYLVGDRIYFKLRDKRVLCSVALNGSDMRQLADYCEGYCLKGDWIYYITENRGMVVEKMRLDGSEQTEVLQFAGKGNMVLFAGDRIIVAGTLVGSDHEQVVAIDLDTMAATVLLDDWCEAFYTAGDYAYYLNYEEGNIWYSIDLNGGAAAKLE